MATQRNHTASVPRLGEPDQGSRGVPGRDSAPRPASRKSNLLVVSDLHHGSIFGLMPPGFITAAGHEIGLNIGQRHLWKCWLDLCERLEKIKIDAVIINGDILDGSQRKSDGVELNLSLLTDQTSAAVESYKPMRKATHSAPVYIVQGTEYHGGKGEQETERLAHAIGAVKYNGIGTGRYSKEILDLEVDGVVVNFSHGISVSGGLYRATSPDREAVWSALAGKSGKMPKADCIVRSHAHYFVHVEHYSKHAVITPSWQLQTRYMRKNSAYRMLPDIGALLIEIDPEAKREGQDPIDIHKILYPLPPITTTKLVR